ncbi:polynucleotide adenylyltransferase PcnB [Vibrio sp. SCSIO 43136]|uniref:polynucleotide adenylyltransferase PcnB n=1 Tax=Vibrio sp. SCSIO 43136 TaxID=2819101 RepID=UPI0020754C00|nr:polynucleotide adenylyltransferase PcnB [Vibrio sp. SCSIO 43136]USD64818.1 polynucleotide adenylyltransferase PcnB [Vibrio sp. SCSIO 43136]
MNLRWAIFTQVSRFCRKILTKKSQDNCRSHGERTLKIFTREEHDISRRQISDNALKVLYRLNNAGYDAFLVGGGVRDLLLGEQPKDFDIATNATPEQIKALFRNCRLIGRRFRLAHIMFGREIIEVATFRGHHQEPVKNQSAQSKEGMLLRDNVYGTVEEDAERRDFTVNAMYYNIADYSIHDYANGVADLDEGVIRLIGDPETRYREDPVRMLRAVRFAAKLDMDIEEKTEAPINELAHLLREIPAARLFEESLKLLQSGYGLETYYLMRDYDLFQQLFPMMEEFLTEANDSKAERMIELVLDSTDKRIQEGKRINPAFMFAAMLWYPLEAKAEYLMEKSGMSYYDAIMEASNMVLDDQVRSIAIPRRHTATIREIWQLQLRLPRRSGKRAFRMLELNKFRAGFDFLEMRGQIEQGDVEELAKWWHTFQDAGRNMRQAMVNDLGGSSRGGQRRRRRPTRKKRAGSD